MIDPALIQACAPNVAVVTIQAIIQQESHGNVLAVNVNGGRQVRLAATLEEAVAQVRDALAHGYSADIGLMQVNSRHVDPMALSVDTLFDPCTNIHAGATVLEDDYRRAVTVYGPGQSALQAALSAYNTGNFTDGFANGYVAQYYARTAAVSVTYSPSVGPLYAADPVVFTRRIETNERTR